jgi:PAS domain S-box-containing protein
LRRLNLLFSLALCALFFFAAVTTASGAESERDKRVLIISTGSRFSPGFALVDQGVLEGLAKILSARVETYAENLDILRFPTERFQRIFTEYLAEKYAEQRPDLIILVYVGNVGIAGKLLQQMFPGTPIIVAGFTEEEVRTDQFGPLVSGIAQRVDPRANLELILRLQPETRRIVVIGGTAEVDRNVLNRAREAARSFVGRVEFEFWDNRSMPELRKGVTALPPQTAILVSRMFRDGAGQAVISTQAGQSIAQWANVPVYVMVDATLGTGAVGGSVGSIEAFGRRAGELARLILTGTAPASLPFEIRTDTVPIFDWRALHRWGISESRLPPNSIVRFRRPLVWDQYRWYILGALVIIGLQSAMIVDLLLQRRRRRRIEAELRESQQLMELATGAGELGLWSRDLKSGDIWANGPMRSLFGFGVHEAVRFEDILGRIHSNDRERMLLQVEHAETAGLPFQGEFRTVLPDGRERWVLAKGKTVVEPTNRKERRMGVVLDITERKRAEERFRLAVEASPSAIVMINPQGEIVLVNTLTEKLFGYTREELIGKSIEILVPERFRADRADFFAAPQSRAMGAGRDLFARRKDGSEFQVEIGLNPIHTNEGTFVLTAIVDITERKRAESELRRNRDELAHVARITTMGELAASLAHELNQPLTAILSNAQAAQRFLANNRVDVEEVREILRDIVDDNNRASEVIRRMRALVRKEELEFNSLDLTGMIREIVLLVHSDAVLHNVRVSCDFAARLPEVRGDKIQLQQVLLNLLLNAFDAMKDCSVEDREVSLRVEGGAGMIEVSVSDHGPGLTSDKLDKIFQPFFTTKREGLGMGLSISRSIIEAHGGRLWAENNNGRGATFHFTVPVAEEGG